MYALDHLETFRGEMKNKERVDGGFSHFHNKMIVAFNPKRVYVSSVNSDGSQGPEALYREGMNDDEVLVATHGFPYINVNLSPTSSLMRRGRHTTILESGGVYLSKVLKATIDKVPKEQWGSTFKLKGEINHRGRPCYQVEIDNKMFGYVKYKAKAGETIRSIAFDHNISEYKIIELNDDLRSYDSSVEEKEIVIPNSYSRKNVLYIDKATWMPLYIENHDDEGLYSVYDYIWIEVNPELPDNAFDPDNPAYGFN